VMSQLEFLLPTQSGLFDIVQKSRNLLSGFAANNRGVLSSRSRNEFEAAAARKSKVPLQTRFNVMGLMRL